ncbi:MAG TPA: AAA family ATPase [Kineosporiaceae bacterium]|nr:AAA family ATPase [Kineosporiaceae bacterium]
MAAIDDPRTDAGDSVAERADGTLLYESGRTRVLRRTVTSPVPPQASGDGASAATMDVIWKMPLGAGAAERRRHEMAVLAGLAAVPGVAHLVPIEAPDGFAVEDVGGVSLASVLGAAAGEGVAAGVGVVDLVRFGLGLARVLAGVHRVGVMHKDINPANILVVGADRRPVLVDWDLATTFAVERPGFTHESTIAGTLAYLAPEQSGRTGRGVDQRADLYAMGATLYECAVGRPPFGLGDALTLIHDHLALVPMAPSMVNVAVPEVLSDIIMRLLEKEPDRRYQSAQGLAHDLARLLDSLTVNGDPDEGSAGVSGFVLGERDFPIRICAPSQLVGRDVEIAQLSAALELAAAGGARGLLVTGAPGVGKSSLIGELRSMVTAKSGWFVQGKFDQNRQDESSDAVAQVIQALARLLLAEPEHELAVLRERIRESVGADADLLVTLLPDFAVLLDIAPTEITGDRQSIVARAFRAGLGMLRALASPERPVVMVIDDLQWAGEFPIAFLDAVLMDETLSGLLLVGAYRDAEVDEAHPLSAMLTRWERLAAAPTRLRLANLPRVHLGTMLGQMLRLPSDRSLELAEAITPRTKGNPYDTVELVNALRREGVLSVGDTGWHWDAESIRRFVGQGDVVDLLIARIEALPAEAVSLLDVLACLGGDVELDLLALAARLDRNALSQALAPTLEDGLLVMINNTAPAVQFRHDRVQQAAAARLGLRPRQLLQLQLARRLAVHPHLEAAAAEQYLASAPDPSEVGERYRVAKMFRAAAAHTRVINQVRSERFLAAAVALLSAENGELRPEVMDFEFFTDLLIEHHAALCSLARQEEADKLYEQIAHRAPGPAELAGAAAAQVGNLTAQGRLGEAVALGIELLTQLGFPPPDPENLNAALSSGLDLLEQWVAAGPQPDELDRPEPSDPRIVAATQVISRTFTPAYMSMHPLMPWLTVLTHRIWVQHGPNAPLMTTLGGLSLLGIVHRQEYVIGYQASQRILAVGEARGYEPATSRLRTTFSMVSQPWHEPMEEVIAHARSAREGLLRHGELQFASYTYACTQEGMLVCAPTLDECATEYATAAAFRARIGDEALASFSLAHRQFIRCLTGKTEPIGTFDDDSFDERGYPERMSGSPIAVFNFHHRRALAAAIFWDVDQLAHHASKAMRFLDHTPGLYSSALTNLLHALACADQVKTAGLEDRPAALSEFDRSRNWIAARAVDAPDNFGYLLNWLDAEKAWSTGEFSSAAAAFDTALGDVTRRTRPWHTAIITERTARFHLAHGLTYTGRILLAQARTHYQNWGAIAKVTELDREFPHLKTARPTQAPSTTLATSLATSLGSGHTSVVSAETIDLMAVLRAAQVLSSETNLDQLRTRIVEVLTTLTGATSVQLLLWNPDAQTWSLPAVTDSGTRTDGESRANAGSGEGSISVDEAGRQGLICLSAFRYAERTQQPLLVPDATHDDRFARDPYLSGLQSCSLLVVPILSRGTPRAMLLMENRLTHTLFTTERLDAVLLIAGQLAVCLDNALAERFRSLVHRSSELTLVCDRTGTISYASTAATDILGIPDAHLTGQKICTHIHPDDRDTFRTWVQTTGPTGHTLECRLHRPTPHWVELTCTDLTTDPAVAALVLHLRDVTDRHTLENELRHAQKLESVGQLAAGIAHEINTPIQFISTNLHFIAESLTPITNLLDGYRTSISTLTTDQKDGRNDGGSDEDSLRTALTTAHHALLAQEHAIDLDFLSTEIPLATTQALDGTHRVARIVHAMKAFAQPSSDTQTPADLNEAIRNTVIVADSHIQPVADVILDLADLPPVLCNLADINQAILNLIINAAHAITDAAQAGRGRGTLTIRTRAETTTGPAVGTVIIEIQDTGTGIPADIADRVFDQFFTTKPIGTGTGQGLALAHTLIHDRHHGTLTFTTTPGTGTTFTIRLPNNYNPPTSGQPA